MQSRNGGFPPTSSNINLNPTSSNANVNNQRIAELENMVTMIQKQLIEKNKEIKALNKQINDLKKDSVSDGGFTKIPIEIVETMEATKPPLPPLPHTPKTKSDPEFFVDIGE